MQHHFKLAGISLIFVVCGCLSAQEPAFEKVAEEAIEHFLADQNSKKEEIRKLEIELLGDLDLRTLQEERIDLSFNSNKLPKDELEKKRKEFKEKIETAVEQMAGKGKQIRGLAKLYDEFNMAGDIENLLNFADIWPLPSRFSPDVDKSQLVQDLIFLARSKIGLKYKPAAERAQAAMNDAIQIEPDNAELQKLLGDALVELEKPDLARKHFSEAIRLEPDNAGFHVSRARTLSGSMGKPESNMFRDDLEKAISLDPDDYRAYCELATNACVNEKFDECIKFAKLALKNKPTCKRDLVALLKAKLQIHSKRKEPEQAIVTGKFLLMVDEENRFAATAIARSLVELNRFGEAEKAYGIALESLGAFTALDTPVETIYYERGLVYKRLGKKSQMVKDFKKAKSSLNKEFAAKVDQEIKTAESEIRLAAATKAIQKSPSDPKKYIERAIELRKQKRYPESVVDIQNAIELDSANSEFYYQLGVTQSWVSHKNAIVSYSKAIELDGQNWKAYNERANSFRWNQKFDEAVADCTHVIDSLANNEDPTRHEILQRAYLCRGHVNRLLQRDALADYEAGRKRPGGLKGIFSTWIYDFRAKENCDLLEFELPIETNPDDIDTRLARVERILRFLKYDLQRRAKTGEFEGGMAGAPRMWANNDLDVVLRQEPGHKRAMQLKELLWVNENESLRQGGRRAIVPDDMQLMLKSVEDNWRRQRNATPRANK